MTHRQKRTLAHYLLTHGYDNLREFWGEITQEWDDRPDMEDAFDVLHAWCKHLIVLADKV